MKKILLLCILVFGLFTSCSKEDDPGNVNSINPPVWIQGTWGVENGTGTFRFTQDDMLIISPLMEVSMKTQLTVMAGGETQVEENSDDDSYEISFFMEGVTQSYHFLRIDENTIHWTTNGMEHPLLRM